MFNKNNCMMDRQMGMMALAGFWGMFQVAGEGNNTPWWLIIVLVVVVLLLLFVPELRRRWRGEGTSSAGLEGVAAALEPEAVVEAAAPVAAVETESPAAAAVVEEAPAAPPEPDDLTRIEGIGPKISSLLQEANISTFAQLAGAEVSHLNDILRAARLRIADPGTWPEQAGLAAAGEWEALEKLQAELKGGRRVT